MSAVELGLDNSIPEAECIEHLVSSDGTCVHCGARVYVVEGWWLKVSGQGGDSTTEYGSLTEALDAWREVLEHQPLADLQVLHALGDAAPTVYADVAEHDTCTVHRSAVYSKHIECPECSNDSALQGHVEAAVRDALDKVTDALTPNQVDAIVRRVVTAVTL